MSIPCHVSRYGWRILVAVAVVVAAASCGTFGTGPADSSSQRARVAIEGVTTADFHEVTGLKFEVDVIEVMEGGGTLIRKLPGTLKYNDIVLKRGYTNDTALYDWATAKACTGNVLRAKMSVQVLDQSGTPIATYNVVNAWPKSYEGPTLSASTNEMAIETIVLTHEGMSLVKN